MICIVTVSLTITYLYVIAIRLIDEGEIQYISWTQIWFGDDY